MHNLKQPDTDFTHLFEKCMSHILPEKLKESYFCFGKTLIVITVMQTERIQ